MNFRVTLRWAEFVNYHTDFSVLKWFYRRVLILATMRRGMGSLSLTRTHAHTEPGKEQSIRVYRRLRGSQSRSGLRRNEKSSLHRNSWCVSTNVACNHNHTNGSRSVMQVRTPTWTTDTRFRLTMSQQRVIRIVTAHVSYVTESRDFVVIRRQYFVPQARL
jgi:hypothetical protein